MHNKQPISSLIEQAKELNTSYLNELTTKYARAKAKGAPINKIVNRIQDTVYKIIKEQWKNL